MNLYTQFNERDYNVNIYLPSKNEEELEWYVKITKEDKLVKELKISMNHVPIFGPDIEDISNLEEKVDEALRLLNN